MSFSSDWVARAIAFFEALEIANPQAIQEPTGCAPPLTVAELNEFLTTKPVPIPEDVYEVIRYDFGASRSLLYPLPGALREFYLEGAAALSLRYAWSTPDHRGPNKTIFGGIDMDYPPVMQHYYALMFSPKYHPEAELVARCTPFVHLTNGDYYGLLNDTGEDDPPVVLLSHDSDSYYTSLNFREFLLAWEQTCYMEPKFWKSSGWASYDEERRWIRFGPTDVPGVAEFRKALFDRAAG